MKRRLPIWFDTPFFATKRDLRRGCPDWMNVPWINELKSVRSWNCLARLFGGSEWLPPVRTTRELICLSHREAFMRYRGLGEKTLAEIVSALRHWGVEWPEKGTQ